VDTCGVSRVALPSATELVLVDQRDFEAGRNRCSGIRRNPQPELDTSVIAGIDKRGAGTMVPASDKYEPPAGTALDHASTKSIPAESYCDVPVFPATHMACGPDAPPSSPVATDPGNPAGSGLQRDWQSLPQFEAIDGSTVGMVSVPVEPAYQVPFVPQGAASGLMLDPLMSSMSASVAGPVQKGYRFASILGTAVQRGNVRLGQESFSS